MKITPVSVVARSLGSRTASWRTSVPKNESSLAMGEPGGEQVWVTAYTIDATRALPGPSTAMPVDSPARGQARRPGR